MTMPIWTQEQVLLQLDSGYHWTTNAIFYGFPKSDSDILSPDGESVTFEPLNSAQVTAARLAFATWNDLVKLSVTECTQWSEIPDITLGNTSATGVVYAYTYYPSPSSIWLNAGFQILQNPVVGDYGFQTFSHEIGHSLGLNHMGTYDGEGSWTPSCFQDSTVYSIMSYFGPDHERGEGQVAWGNWAVEGVIYSPQTPMLNDVMAIQSIYGANTTTRAGDTVYGFHSTITGNLSAIYDFTQNKYPILCIYDAGGTDTLDLSGWSTQSTINLNSGSFSSCNGMTSNLSIAYNCDIENLITGAGQDTLIGNQFANLLIAGSGNDLLQGNGGGNLLDGGDGTDTALYLDDIQNYRISFNGNSFQVTEKTQGHDSADTLQNIEQIQFANITENIHSASLSDNECVLISGLSQTYQIAVDNEYVVLSDLVAGRSGITLYSHVDRVQFNDLVAGLDVGVGENTGEVYRLYLTVLGRNPEADPVGCGFWIDKLDRAILNVEQMVGNFLNSNEFVTRFGGTTNTNESFVNLMYLNLLGRDGHPDSGFSFWLNVLNNHQASREQVVVGFMESPENVSNAAPLIGDSPTYQQWVG